KTIEQIAPVRAFAPVSPVSPNAASKEPITGRRPLADILKSMLAFLSEGRTRDFVAGFQSSFEFTDHALDLQFSEHQKLIEFLEKSRELFPDMALEVVSVLQSGDTAVAEWTLTATQPISAGSMNPLTLGMYRPSILLSGVSIALFSGGKVTRWSDYYDQ